MGKGTGSDGGNTLTVVIVVRKKARLDERHTLPGSISRISSVSARHCLLCDLATGLRQLSRELASSTFVLDYRLVYAVLLPGES